MKKSKAQEIDIARCEMNAGQIDWLPENPRQATKQDVDRTMASIREDEDFLEDRPILVTPGDTGLVVFGGNLRMTAARKVGLKTIPAVIYEPENEADRETIKRRAIKDNGSYGAWDYDILANKWDGPLGDWGVPAWATPDFSPNLNPVDGVAPVTDADIKKEEAALAGQFADTDQNMVEVICPHCGEKFYIKG